MHRVAVFPGSFDPITLGHVNIIERVLPLFDKIIIAVGNNSQKKSYFTMQQRMGWLNDLYKNENKIEAHAYEGLTVSFCKEHNAQFIVRGLRSTTDYEYERIIAQTNKTLIEAIETIFILSAPEFAHISSTIVKEVLKNGGDIGMMVPAVVTRDASV